MRSYLIAGEHFLGAGWVDGLAVGEVDVDHLENTAMVERSGCYLGLVVPMSSAQEVQVRRMLGTLRHEVNVPTLFMHGANAQINECRCGQALML